MIDGVHVDELDKGRIRDLLRGPVGSKVTLTVIRGEEVVHLEVTREGLGAAQALKERQERIE
jgi:C-terminal processing protease CtpA/Prc